MVKIEDNYLDKDYFKSLQDLVFSNNLQWYYQSTVAFKDEKQILDNYYFCHQLYNHFRIQSDKFNMFVPILEKLNVRAIRNIKLNLYPRTPKLFKHNLHKDQDFQLRSALLYLNTCDGYTYLKEQDKKVQSVENRILHFNSFNEHHSTTTTDQNVRITLNINYF